MPQDWINVAGVTAVLDELVNRGLAKPAVLVMPDANGGQRVSLQCLNVPHGPADMTYLGQDVPADVEAMLAGHVQPVGSAWGIAGYSEGGYCAANLALHLRRSYGFAGVLSGYFYPQANDLLADGQPVRAFASKHQFFANAPAAEVRSLHPGAVIPQFWVGAGATDRADVQAADYFVQLLALYQVVPPVARGARRAHDGRLASRAPGDAGVDDDEARADRDRPARARGGAGQAREPAVPQARDRAQEADPRGPASARHGPHSAAHPGPPFISCTHRAPRVSGVHH